MDVIKYLNKAGIEIKVNGEFFIFTLPDKSTKVIKQLDIEKYLFICLLDYINDEET